MLGVADGAREGVPMAVVLPEVGPGDDERACEDDSRDDDLVERKDLSGVQGAVRDRACLVDSREEAPFDRKGLPGVQGAD